jgi:hypothetical protein
MGRPPHAIRVTGLKNWIGDPPGIQQNGYAGAR